MGNLFPLEPLASNGGPIVWAAARGGSGSNGSISGGGSNGAGGSDGSGSRPKPKGEIELPTISRRILERLEALGMSQSELARRSELAQSTINGLINGRSRTSAHLHVIARVLGVSTAWLVGDSDDSSISEDEKETRDIAAEQLGAVLVPVVDMKAPKDGSLTVLHTLPLPTELVAEYATAGLVNIALAKHDSDNMAPTIGSSEYVMIDQAAREISEQDAVWLLTYGGLGMVRRVRRLPDGTYCLTCDNPSVSPIIAAEGEFEVLGRVGFVVKRL